MMRDSITVSRSLVAIVILALVLVACSPSPAPVALAPRKAPVPTVTLVPALATPAPTTAAPAPSNAASAPTVETAAPPKVKMNDQDVQNDTLMIAQVVRQGPGWLVVNNQQDGKTGADGGPIDMGYNGCLYIPLGYDGSLYIPLGDGGGSNDVGLGTTTLLGKILRIDMDSTGAIRRAGGIPEDRPFADGVKGRPEIYAYGLRNPYLLTVDRRGAHAYFVGWPGRSAGRASAW